MTIRDNAKRTTETVRSAHCHSPILSCKATVRLALKTTPSTEMSAITSFHFQRTNARRRGCWLHVDIGDGELMNRDQTVISPNSMPPEPSMGARTYLLISLALISMTSWADRAVFNLLAEPIKRDLHLTDTQLGMLGGIAFAALYATLGIPIARFAERKSRLAITFIALTIWSVATMASAACVNFWQFAVARAGAGIGESACLPCAQSMISDTYPPGRRASAISIYTLGVPIGLLIGMLVGAWIAEAYSWRAAFVVVGAPGVLLALIGAFTLKEPHRGRYDPPTSIKPPSLTAVVRHLWSRRAYRHLTVGAAAGTMLNAGIGAFLAPFVLRGKFGLDLTDVALLGILWTGGGMFAGVLMSGFLADRLARRNAKWTLWVPGIGFLAAAPIWAGAFLTDSLPMFVALAFLGQVAMSVYPAPTFGALNNMSEPRMRATAVAIMGVFNGFIGLGLGPVLVGTISDFLATGSYFTASAHCGSMNASGCADLSYLGLRGSLVVASLLYLWPAAHYLRAGSRLREALIAEHTDEFLPEAASP